MSESPGMDETAGATPPGGDTEVGAVEFDGNTADITPALDTTDHSQSEHTVSGATVERTMVVTVEQVAQAVQQTVSALAGTTTGGSIAAGGPGRVAATSSATGRLGAASGDSLRATTSSTASQNDGAAIAGGVTCASQVSTMSRQRDSLNELPDFQAMQADKSPWPSFDNRKLYWEEWGLQSKRSEDAHWSFEKLATDWLECNQSNVQLSVHTQDNQSMIISGTPVDP